MRFLESIDLIRTPLLFEEEIRAIDALKKGKSHALFGVETLWAVRYDDSQEFFLCHQLGIVRLIRHGNSAGEIILQGENGASHPIAAKKFE